MAVGHGVTKDDPFPSLVATLPLWHYYCENAL